ncbi:hypothetical protein BDW60DRAFT_158069 [Aspergillus nidulans var. acristatus]
MYLQRTAMTGWFFLTLRCAGSYIFSPLVIYYLFPCLGWPSPCRNFVDDALWGSPFWSSFRSTVLSKQGLSTADFGLSVLSWTLNCCLSRPWAGLRYTYTVPACSILPYEFWGVFQMLPGSCLSRLSYTKLLRLLFGATRQAAMENPLSQHEDVPLHALRSSQHSLSSARKVMLLLSAELL